MTDIQPYIITSHRKYIGWILVFFRKLINDEVRRYVDPKFEQLGIIQGQASPIETITCTFLSNGTITFTRTGAKNIAIITKNRSESTFEKIVNMTMMYVNMD